MFLRCRQTKSRSLGQLIKAMDLKQVSYIIPQFYYGLIARITLGALLCLVVLWDYRVDLAPLLALGAFVYTVIGLMAAYTVGFLIDVFTGIVFDIIFLGLRSVARCQENKPEVLINMQKFTRESGKSILKTFQAPRLLRTKSISYENLTGKVCVDSWKVGGVDLQQGFIKKAKNI